jgi:hypothetical protein
MAAAPLPEPRWPLVDRVEELQMVTELLRQDGVGLVTLTGPVASARPPSPSRRACAADQFADSVAFISSRR